LAEAGKQAPVKGRWRRLDGIVRHTFTHFHLELEVLTAEVTIKRSPKGALWSEPSGFSGHALPTLMKKVAKHVDDYSS
jgi:A/G-specific adenine glycosylase